MHNPAFAHPLFFAELYYASPFKTIQLDAEVNATLEGFVKIFMYGTYVRTMTSCNRSVEEVVGGEVGQYPYPRKVNFQVVAFQYVARSCNQIKFF